MGPGAPAPTAQTTARELKGALPQQRAHVRDLEAVERLGDVRQRAAVVRPRLRRGAERLTPPQRKCSVRLPASKRLGPVGVVKIADLQCYA